MDYSNISIPYQFINYSLTNYQKQRIELIWEIIKSKNEKQYTNKEIAKKYNVSLQFVNRSIAKGKKFKQNENNINDNNITVEYKQTD